MKYLQEILNEMGNPSPKSSILPYDYYDAENNIFINQDNIGFMLEVSPIIGGSENVEKQLSLLFDEVLPKDGVLQFLLISSSDISSITNSWHQQYEDADETLQNIANRRISHLQNLTQKGEDAYRIKNYSCIITFSKKVAYSKAAIQEIKEFERALYALLSSLKMMPRKLMVVDLIKVATRIVAPNSVAQDYNKFDKISNQIAPCNPLSIKNDKIEHSGHISKCYGFEQTPAKFSIELMVNLLGDAMRDYLQVPGQLIINYTIYNNISEKDQALMQNKGADLVKQLESFLVKFDTRLKKEAAEWMEVERLTVAGKKLLSTAFTVTLTCKEDEFAQSEQYLTALYIMNGFKLKSLNYFMLPAFLAALPFGGCIFSLLHRFNLAKTTTSNEPLGLLPIHAEWKGNSNEGLLLAGRRGQIFTWSPYFGESNYNLCVIGQSGSGKSVLLQDLVTNLIATNTRVFVLDIGRSFEKLAKLLSGDFIEFSVDSNLSLNPFSNVISNDTKEESDFLSLLLPVIAKMAAPKRGTTDIEDSIIAGVLQEVWALHRNKADINNIIDALRVLKTDVSDNLATMLFQYSSKGSYGRFFEGKANVNFNNKLTVIEFEHLREKKDLMGVIMQMLAVQIMTQIFSGNRQQRFAILFDEAWFCLESFPELMANLARTIRKYNGSLVIGTQSVNDFFVNDISKSILENAGWLTLLKQKKESIEMLTQAKRISLDDNQISLIKSLSVVPKRYAECLISSSSGYVVGRLILDPFSRVLYSTSPQEFHAVNTFIEQGMSVVEAVEKVISD